MMMSPSTTYQTNANTLLPVWIQITEAVAWSVPSDALVAAFIHDLNAVSVLLNTAVMT
jgi:hypothetical protein